MPRRTELRVAKFDMDRLRDQKDQKTVRDVFIFGDPGTGKTTLVKDILWAKWLDVGEDSRVIDDVPHDETTRADMVRFLERDSSDKDRGGTKLFVLAARSCLSLDLPVRLTARVQCLFIFRVTDHFERASLHESYGKAVVPCFDDFCTLLDGCTSDEYECLVLFQYGDIRRPVEDRVFWYKCT